MLDEPQLTISLEKKKKKKKQTYISDFFFVYCKLVKNVRQRNTQTAFEKKIKKIKQNKPRKTHFK